MNFLTLCTYFLEICIAIGALGIFLLPNIIYSAFLLGGVLFCVAGLFLTLSADFIAAAQVLIYVGAINILILFAIMLVNKNEKVDEKVNSSIKTLSSFLVSISFFIILAFTLSNTGWNTLAQIESSNNFILPNIESLTSSSVVKIGIHFFTDFLLHFEIISLLLLVILIGAITIARKEKESQRDLDILMLLKLPESKKGS
jgi:NAD(P)H-quinone oxidoreductase subunit 6